MTCPSCEMTGWKARVVQPRLLEQPLPARAPGRIEAVRHAEARHHVAQLGETRIVFVGDDSEQLELGRLLGRPRRQVLAHRAVHHLVVGPGSDDVVVGATQRHRLHRRARRRVVAIDEEHALRLRMQLVSACEELGCTVLDEQERDRMPSDTSASSACVPASPDDSPCTEKSLPDRRSRSASRTASAVASSSSTKRTGRGVTVRA